MTLDHRNFNFQRTISRPVLEAYLSRAITMNNLLMGFGCTQDHLRMIQQLGAKFIGRALCDIGSERFLPTALVAGRTLANSFHEIDKQIILQATLLEGISKDVEFVTVPAHVLATFSQGLELRSYRYQDMLFPDGSFVDLWHAGASVPDITRVETQMWFYHRACALIDIGIEAIHFGQVQLMGRDDPGLSTWFSLLEHIRDYASRNARRGMVLCDAHVSSGIDCYGLPPIPRDQPLGYSHDGRLLFDFHALPLRIKEKPEEPQKAELEVGHLDSIYGRSKGGITPSGWKCDQLPYLVDIDYWGSTGKGGESVVGKIEKLQGIDSRFWVWGWDEISWFANQTEVQRNDWLWYAWKWIRDIDPNGFMEMPGMQRLVDKKSFYQANMPSKACPQGYGQEETIVAIWKFTPG